MKTAEETHSMLREAHGHDTLSQTTIYEWSKRSKNGRTSMVDYERSGRTSSSELLIAQVKKIHENRRLTLREFVKEVMNASGLEDLLQNTNDNANLLKNVINCDEVWIYGYGVETIFTLEKSCFTSPQENTTDALANERNVA
jgi:hypothetical protein